MNAIHSLSRSRFLRFAAVGGAGFFVNEAALALAHLLGAGDTAAWFIAFAPAVTFTWWGNRVLTFADRASDHHMGILAEWARFVATNSVGAAANFVIYSLLIAFAPWPFRLRYVALGFGVLVGLVFNFTLSKRLVFRGG